MYRWLKVKNYGSNTSCQILSAQAESSSSGALCYTTHSLGDSLILSQQWVSLANHGCTSSWRQPASGSPPVCHSWPRERTGCCFLPEECLAQVGMIPKAASSPEHHKIVQPAMVQLLNWTPWGQKHITGMSLSVLLFSITTTSTTSIPLTYFLWKYIHILVEIKI